MYVIELWKPVWITESTIKPRTAEKQSEIHHLAEYKENKSCLCHTWFVVLMLFVGFFFLLWNHFLRACELHTLCVGVIMGNNAIFEFMLQPANLQCNLRVLCGHLTVWCGSWGFHEATAAPRTDRRSLYNRRTPGNWSASTLKVWDVNSTQQAACDVTALLKVDTNKGGSKNPPS